jgi:O-antigen/teichoic acid export membrane protein
MALSVIGHYINALLLNAILGAASLGLFWGAYRVVEMCAALPGVLATALHPRLALRASQNDLEARRAAERFSEMHMLLGFFVAAIVFGEAPSVVNLLYGPRFLGSIPLLRILSIAILSNYAVCGYSNALIPFGRDRVMIWVAASCAVTATIGGLILIPHFGALGAAAATASVDIVGFAVSIKAYARAIGPPNIPFLLRGGAIAIVIAALDIGLASDHVAIGYRLATASVLYYIGMLKYVRHLKS